MARLKFDYSNRTSSGEKLGRIIAGDLEKRATKKNEEQNKPAATKRRVKSDNNHNAANGDYGDGASNEVVKLDVKVPGKVLTDEGLVHLADGLEIALRTCGNLAFVDLDISGNGLTTRSLARLAPVIQQAHLDLQTLNIASNNISVGSAQEAREWQVFLEAFATCRSLRRLDLSNNTSLGHLAFEILARIHIKEREIDPLPATGLHSVISLPDTCTNGQDDHSPNGQTAAADSPVNLDEDLLDGHYNKKLAKGGILVLQQGLRSLPYITLNNTGLTDTGALFLSFVIEQHFYPIQLVNDHNATPASSQIYIYRQETRSKGIDWEENEATLGKDGVTLLHRAEKVRQGLLNLGEADTMTDSFTFDDADLVSQELKVQATEKELLPTQRRRSSIRSNLSTDVQVNSATDLERARKKVQRSTIMQSGTHNIELWRAGLRVFQVSRQVLMLVPTHRIMAPSSISDEQSSSEDLSHDSENPANSSVSSSSVGDDHHRATSALSVQWPLSKIDEAPTTQSYAAKLTTSPPVNDYEPAFSVTDITNRPIQPVLLRRWKKSRASRKMDVDDKPKEEPYQDPIRLQGTVRRDGGGLAVCGWQRRHLSQRQMQHGGASDGYRDTSLACHLPLPVCLEILKASMDPRDLGILSDRQQKKAFEWGQLEGSLMTEHDWRSKDESSQIWMLLEALECLEYE